MLKTVIRIDIVSDIVCPWCYIGKRRMEIAVKALANEYDFEIRFFPFELNTTIPLEGIDQREYLIDKFGGEEQYHKITNNVATIAAQDGLHLDFEKQSTAPNTRNAHRLIMLAQQEGKHLEMAEVLFQAYFTKGIDLSKIENLFNLADSVGLDKNKINAFLESDIGLVEVVMAETELQRLGVTAVPFYIIEEKYGISGAQSVDTFISAFQNIGKELKASRKSSQFVEESN
jgi:predicted DsbA family dithiol-disulfide isomerase